MIGFYQVNRYDTNEFSVIRRSIKAIGKLKAIARSKAHEIRAKGKSLRIIARGK